MAIHRPRRREQTLPSWPSEGTKPMTLDLWLSASRTMGQHISVVWVTQSGVPFQSRPSKLLHGPVREVREFTWMLNTVPCPHQPGKDLGPCCSDDQKRQLCLALQRRNLRGIYQHLALEMEWNDLRIVVSILPDHWALGLVFLICKTLKYPSLGVIFQNQYSYFVRTY